MAKAILGAYEGDGRWSSTLSDIKYDYDYPLRSDGTRMDLSPGSKIHDAIKDKIIRQAQDSSNCISQRFDSWRKIDQILNVFIPADEAEEKVQDKDTRKPISIVFPNTYAILETMLAYLSTAFFIDPIFRYEGVGPEDTVGAILMGQVIQQQAERAKTVLNLHTMFRDALAYGVGAVNPFWDVVRGTKPRITEIASVNEFGESSSERIIEFLKGQITFEGNALQNIDPYLMLPDPNVSINEIQKGEFWGWVRQTNVMDLLSDEQEDPDMFNAKYLKHLNIGQSSIIDWDQSDRGVKTGLERGPQKGITSTSPIDVIVMFAKIIPKDMKLGPEEYPEIWYFELAADDIVIKARPANYMHGKIPVAACAPEYDGYGIAPISRLEVQYGLQGVLDFLFNSHIANVRKALNDMLVVDPYMVNINDLRNPAPGKLIRMRKPMWGSGVNGAVQQLSVTDVTRGNMSDASFVMSMMQQLSGSEASMMGNLRQGGPERLTSQEFQGTRAGAISRMERVARLISYQAMSDIGHMFASNTQQMMSKPTYIKMVGAWPEVLKREYGAIDGEKFPVDPIDLIIDYDVKIRDGSVPGGNFAQSWVNLFQTIGQSQELTQRFDIVRIFKHIARNLGAKNVEDFERQSPQQVNPEMRSDEDVMREVERGNLVPSNMADVGAL